MRPHPPLSPTRTSERRGSLWRLAGVVLLASACDDSARVLVDHNAWADGDPAEALGSYEGERDPCGVHWVEEGLLELSTAICPYVLLEQPLLADLREGDSLRIGVEWDDLQAEVSAEARLALTIDGAILWEAVLDIPQAGGVEVADTISEIEAAAGAPIVLHVHNHGTNHYRWGAIRARPQ